MAETIPGSLAVIGGRLEDTNAAVYGEMHRLSAGRILVFPTASAEPEAVGQETLAVFRGHGFDAEVAPLTPRNAAGLARDAALIARVADYGSVYFTGGDQANIVAALAPGGVETPLLAAIRAARAAGGLVAGSSAGAAMMSQPMILGGTSIEAVVHGVTGDPAAAGAAARRRARLLPARHGRPALHQARPPRPAGGGDGAGRGAAGLRHRREHRAPDRRRRRAGLRRIRRHAGRHGPRQGRPGRGRLPGVPPQLPRRRRRPRPRPASARGRAPASAG